MEKCEHEYINGLNCGVCGHSFVSLFKELEIENRKLKRQLEAKTKMFLECDKINKQLEQKCQRYEEALKIYGCEDNWLEHSFSEDNGKIKDVLFIKCENGYELAQKALEGE